MKTILNVREKASDIKMFSQTSINKKLKDLTNGKKAYRMIPGSDLSHRYNL